MNKARVSSRDMEGRPQTEVWFRNPFLYVKELAEVGCHRVIFDGTPARKRRLKPVEWCNMNFGANALWSCMVVHTDCTTLFEAGHRVPTAVYPTWSADLNTLEELVDLMKRPWSEREDMREVGRSDNYRPVPGQRHIIVITDLPNQVNGSGQVFLSELGEFQEEHPEVTFFIHGLYGFSAIFGNRFKMADYEARIYAANGHIVIPPGGFKKPEDLKSNPYWIHLLGESLQSLKVPRNRCIYNIKSALWAGSYFAKLEKFAIRKNRKADYDYPLVENLIRTNSMVFTKRLVAQPGDRIVCDDCSLWLSCKFYRERAICAVPESDMNAVAEMFGTRNPDNIIKGLTALVQMNTQRIDRGVHSEQQTVPDDKGNEIEKPVDPNLTKLIAATFDQAQKLLQIVDPTQRPGKAGVTVAINGAAQQVQIGPGGATYDNQALVSQVYNILEARGYRREDITTDQVEQLLQEMMGKAQPAAIPGSVVP